MKPIFVIQMPKDTPPSMLGEVHREVYRSGMTEEYYILLTIGNDTTVTFKCFNTPYSKEEYDKLEELINKINEDYEQRN